MRFGAGIWRWNQKIGAGIQNPVPISAPKSIRRWIRKSALESALELKFGAEIGAGIRNWR